MVEQIVKYWNDIVFFNSETMKTYHNNGKIKEKYKCVNGKKGGLYRKWYKKRQLKKKYIYKEDEKDGFVNVGMETGN